MTATHIALLDPPGVLSVTGADAHKLLNGLVTNDLDRLQAEGEAVHAALLTPQGKILFVFFAMKTADGYLIETSRATVADLAKRLTFYKLRAAVKIEDVSERYALAVAWSQNGTGSAAASRPGEGLAFRDPRHSALGWRMLAPFSALAAANATAAQYHAHRIALGVPDPDFDYPLGDTYPHEADFDLFAGADFDKGCFVGQEVVARMQHKTVVRKRVVRVTGATPLSADHPDVLAGSVAIGRLGSIDGAQALALLRLDRVAEAHDKGDPLTAGGVPVTVHEGDLARYREAASAKAAQP